ncbi:MAG: TetR/AcrR family transcriptional regulator [Rhizobium sp.]|nr:TetR/AcrR family transcriptional regulator [Rhizobium sp.]
MARRGRPTLEESGRLKERIVSAAITMFVARGYAGTTIEDLCASLGIAKRSFYSRFVSKAELFQAAANTYTAATIDRLPPVEPDSRPAAVQLLDVCEDLLRYFLHPDIIAMERSLVAEAGRFPEIVPVLEEVRHRAISRFDPILRLVRPPDAGEIATDAQLLWDLTIAPPMRAAALGLLPCDVTQQLLSVTGERIAFFLAGLTLSRPGALEPSQETAHVKQRN